jgi:hypothetical protein
MDFFHFSNILLFLFCKRLKFVIKVNKFYFSLQTVHVLLHNSHTHCGPDLISILLFSKLEIYFFSDEQEKHLEDRQRKYIPDKVSVTNQCFSDPL